VLLLLLAAGCLFLASCEASFEKQDREFSQATQQRLSANFREQIIMLSEAEKKFPVAHPTVPPPTDADIWWKQPVEGKLFENSVPVKQRLDDLFARALKSSTQIRVFSDLPLIRETGIQEARGRFDTHLFTDAAYGFTNEPVGDLLQTGRTGRFREWGWNVEAGVKKKLITGADVKLSQLFIRKNNNSNFTVPNPQAYAKLALTFIQPMLKGGGIEYNRSIICIAKIDSDVARREFIRQAEAHLVEITRSYWNLYLARALVVQKHKLLVTYKGAGFDLRFIEEEFSGIGLDQIHIDLRFPLYRVGLKGGLKAIERTVGISRAEETQGLDGFDAVRLWKEYEAGKQESLDLLVAYNREDIVNLEALMRIAYSTLRRSCFL